MAFPLISRVAEPRRPFWSVMIPTYEPCTEFLARALGSVVEQLTPGPAVEIVLVDDASPSFDPEAFLHELGVPGITWYRGERRLGLAGNWNRCVTQARGRWLHLLHQDDFVLRGFYRAMREGIEDTPGIGAAFCDTYFMSRGSKLRKRTTIRAARPGVLGDWHQHVFVQLAIQTPAIVVCRDTYEAIGGFDDDFQYVLDWDLWKRVAARLPIWYDPRPLACYRVHRTSQTARLRHTGRNVAEISASIRRSEALLPPAIAADISKRARRAYSLFAVESAWESVLSDRAPRAAIAQLVEARRMSSSTDVARAIGWLALRTVLQPARDVLVRD